VIDWVEAAPGLFVFCAVLAFSRWRFVRFAADQKATTTLAMISDRDHAPPGSGPVQRCLLRRTGAVTLG
jgi:hypothetical protein